MLDERLCDMNDIEISTLQLDILLIGAFRSGLTDLPNDRDNLNGQSWLQISCRCSQPLLMHNHLCGNALFRASYHLMNGF